MKHTRSHLAALAALVLCLAAPASAEVFEVKAADYLAGAPANFGVAFAGNGADVSLQALGLVFDKNDNVWRGFGSFEVREGADFARTRLDHNATFIVGLIDAPGGPGCSGKAVSLLIVHGQDPSAGHYTLIAGPEDCVVGDGLCPESRVSAELNTAADAEAAAAAELALVGPKSRASSWGRIKATIR